MLRSFLIRRKEKKIVNQNTVDSKKELENLNIRPLSMTDVEKEHQDIVVYFWGKFDNK